MTSALNDGGTECCSAGPLLDWGPCCDCARIGKSAWLMKAEWRIGDSSKRICTSALPRKTSTFINVGTVPQTDTGVQGE